MISDVIPELVYSIYNVYIYIYIYITKYIWIYIYIYVYTSRYIILNQGIKEYSEILWNKSNKCLFKGFTKDKWGPTLNELSYCFSPHFWDKGHIFIEL